MSRFQELVLRHIVGDIIHRTTENAMDSAPLSPVTLDRFPGLCFFVCKISILHDCRKEQKHVHFDKVLGAWIVLLMGINSRLKPENPESSSTTDPQCPRKVTAAL